MKDLKSVVTTDVTISRLQSNLDSWAKSVKFDGVNDGLLLKNVVLLAADVNLVEHKLGREPRGYFPMLKGNSIIWNSQDANVFKTKSLALECSADVTIDLWVF